MVGSTFSESGGGGGGRGSRSLSCEAFACGCRRGGGGGNCCCLRDSWRGEGWGCTIGGATAVGPMLIGAVGAESGGGAGLGVGVGGASSRAFTSWGSTNSATSWRPPFGGH